MPHGCVYRYFGLCYAYIHTQLVSTREERLLNTNVNVGKQM